MPKLKPMKGYLYDPKKIVYPCFVQEKLNGIRAYYRNGSLYSSDGCKYNSEVVKHILRELINWPKDVILDGELYVHGWSLQRINSAVGVNRKEPIADSLEVKYCVFDLVDLTIPFQRRHQKMLRTLCDTNIKSYDAACPIKHVAIVLCLSEENGDMLYDAMVQFGYEGAIYRVGANNYVYGRTSTMYKRKKYLDDDFLIVGKYAGKRTDLGSRLIHTLGGIECQMKDGKTFRVGSGFTDIERDEIWTERVTVVGRTAKVKYEMLSDDGIPLKPTLIAIL